jgi:hypothetical protein
VLDRNGLPVRGQTTRVLPAATAFQTVRTAAKLDFDISDVLTMVANAVTLSARFPKARSAPCATTLTTRPAPDREAPDRSVRTSRTDGCLPGKRGVTAEMPRGVASHGG